MLSEPLLHFFLAGLLLFAVFAFINRDAMPPPNAIVVDDARIAAMREQFIRTWRRPPTTAELDGLVDSWIREEALYREGLAMGLGADDPVIRRRIAQNVEFVSDFLVDEAITDQQLRAWFDENRDSYRVEPKLTFRQRFIDPSRHQHNAAEVAAAALVALDAGNSDDVGDPTLLPADVIEASPSEITRIFGQNFVESLADLPVARWQGPVESAYGLHLVYIEQRTEARIPELSEVRAGVERDLLSARRASAQEAWFDALMQRYTIMITAQPESGSTATSE